MASRSISCRMSTGGQSWPTTCSLSCSPAPRPSEKRPSDSSASVAAFCATTTGWYRTIGHVTYVMKGMRSVACATAPSTDHVYGEWPCTSSHGK